MAPTDLSEEDSAGQTTNIISVIGDPLGKVLNVGLKPIGHFIGAIANPPGQALLDVQEQVKKEYAYVDESKEKVEKQGSGGEGIGGKEEKGGNLLGL